MELSCQVRKDSGACPVQAPQSDPLSASTEPTSDQELDISGGAVQGAAPGVWGGTHVLLL